MKIKFTFFMLILWLAASLNVTVYGQETTKKTDLRVFLKSLPKLVTSEKPVKNKPDAQFVITCKKNAPRPGDELIKETIGYCEPGSAGRNVTWDFSRAKPQDEYTVNYLSTEDGKLLGIENATLFDYRIAGDSLLLSGFENSLMINSYQEPELVLKYPVSYLSSSENFYYGHGKYCDRLEYLISGNIETLADGYGKLILPGKEILEDVMRVHTKRREVEHYQPLPYGFNFQRYFAFESANDSLAQQLENAGLIETDIYQWYAEGYRYPVLETIKTQRVANGSKTLVNQIAFLFHPDSQRLLPEDPENAALQEQKLKSSLPTTILSMNIQAGIRIYPNPVVDELTISLEPQQRESVQIFLYDMQGKLLYKSQPRMSEGSFSEKVPMGSYPQGSYLVRVQAGERSEKKVIVKQ